MRRKDIIIILLLLILVLVFFRKLLNPNKIFLGADLSILYPIKEFLVSKIKQGIFPLWNPYVFCGAPSASHDLMFGLFYPFNLIFLILPLNTAFTYSVIIHIFLAGLFMFILAKSFGLDISSSLFSSITFMFSGASVTLLVTGAMDLLCGITWIPLILLFFGKAIRKINIGKGILAGISLGMQGLGGHPQVSMITIYMLIFYFLYVVFGPLKKKVSPKYIGRLIIIFGVTLFFGIGLYAVQVFPSLEVFLNYSMRSFKMDYNFATSYSLHPKQLLTFLIPNLFGNPITGYYWGEHHFEEICRYVGLLPLFLTAIAVFLVKNKFVKFYLGLLVISILIALGSYTPIYRLCYYLLPGFKIFRCPVRWLFLSTFSFSILAGFGLSFLIDRINHKQNLRFLIKGLLLFNILVILSLCLDYFMKIDIVSQLTKWAAISSFGKGVNFQYRFSIVKESLLNFTLLLTAIVFCLIAFWKDKISSFLFKISVLIILVFDLWFFGQRFIVPVDKELYLNSKQWEFFKSDKDFYRIFVELPINDYSALVNRCFVFGGEAGDLELKSYNTFKNKVKNFPQILNSRYCLTTRFIDIPNTEFIKTIKTIIFDPFNFKKFKIYESPANIYRYKNFLPRAFIIHKVIIAKDNDEIFRELNDISFNPQETAILEGEGFFLNMPAEPRNLNGDSIEIILYSPNRIKLKANLEQAGLLVLNEIFFPGWQVYVDGKREHIFKANYIMRSVYLKEGKHTVEFIYRPLSFKIGAIITLLTFFILLSLGIKQFYIAVKMKQSQPL